MCLIVCTHTQAFTVNSTGGQVNVSRAAELTCSSINVENIWLHWGREGGESAGIRTWRVLYVQQWSLNLGEKTHPACIFTLSDFYLYRTCLFISHWWI